MNKANVGADDKSVFEVMADYNRMKQLARKCYSHGRWERALRIIFIASGFMYTMNQIQCDTEMEDLVIGIAASQMPKVEMNKNDKCTVMYYDGLGSADRGLTRIYLEALVNLGYTVKYITFQALDGSGGVSSLIEEQNISYIKGNTLMEQMYSLRGHIESSGASAAFLNMNPDDVVAVGAFSLVNGQIKRYLINITDHAFWIGSRISDVVINFREFGYKVCRSKRNISEEKLVFLPYYPAIQDASYKGLSFNTSEYKFFLSGGALYKTFSKDNKYYLLVDTILSTYKNLVFIYLGNGDAGKILRLAEKYPGRVFYERERTDFFEILKKSLFYLSTYPYNGGLMTQYALLAERIPVTLVCQDIEQELSIRDQNAFWKYATIADCVAEIGRLLSDSFYRESREKMLHSFLITEEEFTDELDYIINHGKSKRSVGNSHIFFCGFMRQPLENCTGLKYYRLFYRKKGLFLIKVFPIKYGLGLIEMFREKFLRQ